MHALQGWEVGASFCALLIDRAAMSAESSPDNSKLAAGSSSKSVPVCFHDSSQCNDWYISMQHHHEAQQHGQYVEIVIMKHVGAASMSSLSCMPCQQLSIH